MLLIASVASNLTLCLPVTGAHPSADHSDKRSIHHGRLHALHGPLLEALLQESVAAPPPVDVPGCCLASTYNRRRDSRASVRLERPGGPNTLRDGHGAHDGLGGVMSAGVNTTEKASPPPCAPLADGARPEPIHPRSVQRWRSGSPATHRRVSLGNLGRLTSPSGLRTPFPSFPPDPPRSRRTCLPSAQLLGYLSKSGFGIRARARRHWWGALFLAAPPGRLPHSLSVRLCPLGTIHAVAAFLCLPPSLTTSDEGHSPAM